MSSRRRYDHRIRDHVARTGNVDLFPELDIARSTARSWVRRGPSAVVSLEHELDDIRALRERLIRVERRLAIVNAVMTLLLAMTRTLSVSLARTRVPKGAESPRRSPGRGLHVGRPPSSAAVTGPDQPLVVVRQRVGQRCSLRLPAKRRVGHDRVVLAHVEADEATYGLDTPDEVYFGNGAGVPDELAAARGAARAKRIAENRAARCERCTRPPPTGEFEVAA